jgi:hypothetical protein
LDTLGICSSEQGPDAQNIGDSLFSFAPYTKPCMLDLVQYPPLFGRALAMPRTSHHRGPGASLLSPRVLVLTLLITSAAASAQGKHAAHL